MEKPIANSKHIAEYTERDDGTTLVTVPICRRFPLFTLLVDMVALPVFLIGFSMADDHSWSLFAYAWLTGLFLFFLIWFSFSLSYLFSHRKYQLEIDQHGVRERLLASKRTWLWGDILEIGIFSYDANCKVGFLLKRKSLSRRLRITSFDAVLQNRYAMKDREIVEILRNCREMYSETSIQPLESC